MNWLFQHLVGLLLLGGFLDNVTACPLKTMHAELLQTSELPDT